MSKAKKGGQFEREICKRLSKWWSGGLRDDIFWRCSQSGGRATQRMKKGQRTAGSYGDITAVDPEGVPLLKMWTIELKRGRAKSHGDVFELVERESSDVPTKFERTLAQTIRSAQHAGSNGWMLIYRKDYRRAVVFLDYGTARHFPEMLVVPCHARFHLPVRLSDSAEPVNLRFVAFPLEFLLAAISPRRIRALVA